MSKDRYGLTVSTRSAGALEAYVDGVDRLLSASAGADDCFARAILADDPAARARRFFCFFLKAARLRAVFLLRFFSRMAIS